MKYRPDTVEVDAYAGAPTLGYLSPESDNESFDIPPGDIRSLRLLDDPIEGSLMVPVHSVNMVSRDGIMSSDQCHCRAYRSNPDWPQWTRSGDSDIQISQVGPIQPPSARPEFTKGINSCHIGRSSR